MKTTFLTISFGRSGFSRDRNPRRIAAQAAPMGNHPPSPLKRLLQMIALLGVWMAPAFAQVDLVYTVKADTVFLLLMEPPPEGGGILVYRQGPLPDKTETLITPDTLWSARDYTELQQRIGVKTFEDLMRITYAQTPFQLFRRLQSPFYGFAASVISRKTAKAMARLVLDPGRKQGESYRYRVEVFNTDREKVGEPQIQVVVKEPPIPSPKAKEVKAEKDGTLRVLWGYHSWGSPEEDPAVAFHVYRKGPEDKNFIRLTPYPILRTQALEYKYHDQDVKLGKTYEYRITAMDFAGRESDPSEVLKGVPVDLLPPRVPTDVQARYQAGRVIVQWQPSPSPDVAGYHIYRSQHLSQPMEKLTPTPLSADTHQFEDTTGTPGTQYFYSVSAVDRSGNESRPSNPIAVIFRDEVPPDPPTNVQAEFKDNAIYITWKPSKAQDLLGYYVYRGERKDPLPRILKDPLDIAMTGYVDRGYGGKGFKPGATYYVGVSAIDRSLNESEVQVVKVKVPDTEPPLPVPQVDVHLQKDGSVKVVWGRSVSLDVAQYEVYRLEGETRTLLVTLAHPSQVFVDTTVKVGTTYRYAVVALDSVQNRSQEVLSDPILARDQIPPPEPESVVVVVDSPGVRITWKPVEVPDLAGYRVVRSDLPNGRYKPVHDGLLSTPTFHDPTGKPYHFYRVLAIDTSGNESKTRHRYQAKQ